MDSTAISLCMDNKLPIIVFNLTVRGNIKRVLIGEELGTVVQGVEDGSGWVGPKVYADLEKKMKTSLEAFRKELNSIHTGRASLSLLDGIAVQYYGVPTPLNQVPTVPESRLITIQPWDGSVIGEVEKAILKSDLGLTPSNDGRVIKIPIPPLTEERRKQLARAVKKLGEDCKVSIRNVRREGNDDFKNLEKDKKISEDELRRAQDQVQKLTDRYIAMAEQVSAQKEKGDGNMSRTGSRHLRKTIPSS